MDKIRLHAFLASAAAAAAAAIGQIPSLAHADAIWTGTDSTSWSDGGNWTGGTGAGGVPGATDYIYIGENSPSTATVNYNVGTATTLTTSGALVVSQSYTLTASASESVLGLDGGYANAATTTLTTAGTGLDNGGTINFTGAAGTYWSIGLGERAGSAAISTNDGTIEATGGGAFGIAQNTSTGGIVNTGTIAATGGSTLAFAEITGYNSTSGAYTFTNGGAKIVGGTVSSSLGSTITNGSIINSSAYLQGVQLNNAGTLTLGDASAGYGGDNYSALWAYSSSTFTNSGAVNITNRAYGNTSGLGEWAGLVIGTATVSGSAAPPAYSSSSTADSTSLINSGNINITNNGGVAGGGTAFAGLSLNTNGAITNNGTITISDAPTLATATNTQAYLSIGRNTTIGGDAGSIVFTPNVVNGNYVEAMTSLTTAPTLTLGSGQTLSGSVNLGNGTIGITNNGTIRANSGSAATPITILTAGSGFINNGTLSVTNGSLIQDQDAGLTFAPGSTCAVEIDSNTLTSGLIAASGELVLGSGVANLSLTDADGTPLSAGEVFTLIDPASSSGGYFAGLPQGADVTVGPNTFQISYDAGPGDDEVTLTSVVPEPASAALFALASLGVLRRRRARRSA